MVVPELITHFVTAGLSLALTFAPILDSVRAIADSVGAVIVAVVDSVGAVIAAIVDPVGTVVSAIVDAIRAISGRINSGTLP